MGAELVQGMVMMMTTVVVVVVMMMVMVVMMVVMMVMMMTCKDLTLCLRVSVEAGEGLVGAVEARVGH